jgi:hypothetical protein
LDTTLINQTDLYTGTHRAEWTDIVNKPAAPNTGGGEIETQTKTQLSTIDVGLLITPTLRLNVVVPWVDRTHSTLGFQSEPIDATTVNGLPASTVHFQSLGDVKVLLNLAQLLPIKNLRINMGLQLPTGAAGDGSTAKLFQSGPGMGTPLDASLQPGTGNTSLLFGAQYAQAMSDTSDLLTSFMTSTSIKQRFNQIGDDYRVGNSQTLTLGWRNQQTSKVSTQLQLNINHKSEDSGELADPFNTSGWSAYLTPGVRVSLSPKDALYSFLQLPIYRQVTGYQLMPKFILSVGWTHGF